VTTFPNTDTTSLTHWSNFSGTLHARDIPVFATPRPISRPLTEPDALVPQADAIRAILRHCFENGLKLRAMGSRWSFSRILEPDRVIVDPAYLNAILRVGADSLTEAYRAGRGAEGYAPFWIQGGRTVAAINQRLLEEGFCLQTSGADDGQRLAGCIATGTHSSAIGIGAMHDTVLGIHLIVGPDAAVFLQPSTGGAVTDAFVAWLEGQTGMTVVHHRDDALFRAALVSLGSLGFVFSAVVEAAPKYRLLQRVWRVRDRQDPQLWEIIETLRLHGLHSDQPDRPYHLDVVFHPYETEGPTEAWVTTMWKVPADGFALAHALPLELSIASDIMDVIVGVADGLDGVLPDVLTTFVLSEVITEQTEGLYGTGTVESFPGEVFGGNNLPAGYGASTEIIVDHARTREVVALLWDVLAECADRGQHLLGGMALRFVPATTAHLGMNVGAMNSYLEFPTVRSEGSLAVFRAMWDALDARGIPYACHWGQLHGMNRARMARWYGPRIDAWKVARDQLLTPEAKAVFSAPILSEVGLE
jgi:FAD/FMN-containing dehydrogenase